MSNYVLCACGTPKVRKALMCRGCRDRLRWGGPVRYPYAPLKQRLGGTSWTQAARLGVSRDVIRLMIRRGLNAWQADRYAVAAGVHPCALWPSWFTDALTEEDAA